jgi:hypothetical protein
VVGRDRDGVQLEHQVGQHAARDPSGHLGDHRQRGLGSRDPSQQPFDDADHRVEARGHRLQGQDQRDQGRAGDQAVLQQLETDVVR